MSEAKKPFYDPYRDGVTQGALQKWMTCPEKARLSLFEGFSPSFSKEALEVGNIIHENLDRVYTWLREVRELNLESYVIDVRDVVQVSIAIMRQQEIVCHSAVHSPQDGELMEKSFAIAASILPHYFPQWSRDFNQVKWVSLEEEFCIPIQVYPYGHWVHGHIEDLPKVNLRGKIDGIFELNGDLWLFETKSKARIDDPTIMSRLSLDLQTFMYMHVASILYQRPIKGFVYNLIKRPELRIKVNERIQDFGRRCSEDIRLDPSKYFKRIEVVVTKEDTDKFAEELKNIIGGFLGWCDGNGQHYRNSGSCHNGMYACEFLRGCGDGRWESFTQRKEVFPELPGTHTP